MITFLDESRSYSYQLKMISEDRLALEGLNLQEGRSRIKLSAVDFTFLVVLSSYMSLLLFETAS